jgi:uncharacterized protein YjdB
MIPSTFAQSLRLRRLVGLLAVSTLALAACADSGKSGRIVEVEIVTVPNNLALTNLVPGTTRQLLGVPTNASGDFVDKTVTFTSSNEAVATVSPTGFVEAITGGTAYIRATAGGRTDSIVVEVRLPVGTIVIAETPDTLRRESAHQLELTVLDTQGAPVTDRSITFTSSDESIATVTAPGNVLASWTNEGTVTITATAANASDGGVAVVQTRVFEVFGEPAVNAVQMTGVGGFIGNASADVQLTGTPLSSAANVVPGVTLTWSTSAPAVATVDADGLVTFVGGVGPATISAKTATYAGSPDTVSGTVAFEVAPQLALGDSVDVTLIPEGESYDYAIEGGAADAIQVTTFAGSNGDVDLYIFAPGVLNPVANNAGGTAGQYLCRPWSVGSNENCDRVFDAAGWYRVRLYAYVGDGDVIGLRIRYRLRP